jgi:hypothetical protein
LRVRDETQGPLAEGRRLFNAGRFFEAHEVWESAWLREEGEIRALLQGLIQIAAGFHQGLDRRNPTGCARLLSAGAARLEPLSGDCAGLALAPLREAVSRVLAKARDWESGSGEPLGGEDAPPIGLAKE